jgi:hypothetical protein
MPITTDNWTYDEYVVPPTNFSANLLGKAAREAYSTNDGRKHVNVRIGLRYYRIYPMEGQEYNHAAFKAALIKRIKEDRTIEPVGKGQLLRLIMQKSSNTAKAIGDAIRGIPGIHISNPLTGISEKLAALLARKINETVKGQNFLRQRALSRSGRRYANVVNTEAETQRLRQKAITAFNAAASGKTLPQNVPASVSNTLKKYANAGRLVEKFNDLDQEDKNAFLSKVVYKPSLASRFTYRTPESLARLGNIASYKASTLRNRARGAVSGFKMPTMTMPKLSNPFTRKAARRNNGMTRRNNRR